jgi:hypothetical protein
VLCQPNCRLLSEIIRNFLLYLAQICIFARYLSHIYLILAASATPAAAAIPQNQNYNPIRRHLAEIPPAYSPKLANILLPRLLKPTICRRWQALPLLSRHTGAILLTNAGNSTQNHTRPR